MAETPTAAAIMEIERLVGEALGKTVVIDGVEYATRALHDPRKAEPEPATVEVATLQSFADIVNASVGAIHDNYAVGRGKSLFVHVESPTEVRLCTGVFGKFNQRVDVARADAIVPQFGFGNWTDPESFNISIQTMFLLDDERSDLLKLTGNLKWEAEATTAEDGATQRVGTKVGLSMAGTTSVKNPWDLRPYRTFAEVAQPTSAFILRARGGGDRQKQLALFEADGGAWRLDAIKSIKSWLAERVAGVAVYG